MPVGRGVRRPNRDRFDEGYNAGHNSPARRTAKTSAWRSTSFGLDILQIDSRALSVAEGGKVEASYYAHGEDDITRQSMCSRLQTIRGIGYLSTGPLERRLVLLQPQ